MISNSEFINVESSKDKLKLVTLDYPVKIWDDPKCTHYFQKILSVKLKGYYKEFDLDILPIDTTDYIAIHQAVCIQEELALRPIMVFKTIPLSRCQTHRVVFPVLAMTRAAQALEHSAHIADIIKAANMNRKELGYSCCWTVDPQFRKDREFARQLREVTMAVYMHTHRNYNIDEHLVSATLKFQTDKLFHDYGHRKLIRGGKELPSIKVAHVFDEEAAIMYVRKFSKYAEGVYQKWSFLWEENLLYYGPSIDEVVTKKAS